eukprot:scaffold630_cov399-Prasinococcus_capsulatus_cf.AAC.12
MHRPNSLVRSLTGSVRIRVLLAAALFFVTFAPYILSPVTEHYQALVDDSSQTDGAAANGADSSHQTHLPNTSPNGLVTPQQMNYGADVSASGRTTSARTTILAIDETCPKARNIPRRPGHDLHAVAAAKYSICCVLTSSLLDGASQSCHAVLSSVHQRAEVPHLLHPEKCSKTVLECAISRENCWEARAHQKSRHCKPTMDSAPPGAVVIDLDEQPSGLCEDATELEHKALQLFQKAGKAAYGKSWDAPGMKPPAPCHHRGTQTCPMTALPFGTHQLRREWGKSCTA